MVRFMVFLERGFRVQALPLRVRVMVFLRTRNGFNTAHDADAAGLTPLHCAALAGNTALMLGWVYP